MAVPNAHGNTGLACFGSACFGNPLPLVAHFRQWTSSRCEYNRKASHLSSLQRQSPRNRMMTNPLENTSRCGQVCKQTTLFILLATLIPTTWATADSFVIRDVRV